MQLLRIVFVALELPFDPDFLLECLLDVARFFPEFASLVFSLQLTLGVDEVAQVSETIQLLLRKVKSEGRGQRRQHQGRQ